MIGSCIFFPPWNKPAPDSDFGLCPVQAVVAVAVAVAVAVVVITVVAVWVAMAVVVAPLAGLWPVVRRAPDAPAGAQVPSK